jgi:TolB-like protein/Flp pilus assembly protein TadD
MSSAVVRFASFELDCRSRELREGERCVRLQEQPFEILRLMLERAGEVVTRDELRRRLWPDGTFVDFDHSLNAAIKRLRAALGDDADRPRFVETVPRRGYRFIARVAGDGPAATPEAPAPRPRLAVLPFVNLSDDGAQEYFSDGLTEEMIAQLGSLCRGRLGVLARWSSMVFKGSLQSAREVGEALRADYLLEGSVRREGARVRITARLLETREETQLWSETYERSVTDYLSVQTEVATRIARSLAMEFAPPPAAPAIQDADAYQAYLKGRYYWNKPGDSGLDRALEFFTEGLKTAPAFAAAHAAMARAMVSRAEYYRDVPRLALERARHAAVRALELDPNQAEAHLAMADVRRMLDHDWSAAESSYVRAIALNPSYEGARRSLAMMLSSFARHGEAVREAERAIELDPFCLVVSTSAAWTHYAAGDYPAAIARCRYAIDLDPDYLPARRMLAAAYLQTDRRSQAVAVLEEAAAIGTTDPVVLSWLAHVHAVTGAPDEARRLILRVHSLEQTRHVPTYHLALAYTGLGDIEKAFELLERACLDRDPALPGIMVEPRFALLRADPRYHVVLERLNLSGLLSGTGGSGPRIHKA